MFARQVVTELGVRVNVLDPSKQISLKNKDFDTSRGSEV